MIFKNWTEAKKLKSYLFLVSILVPKHPGAELLQVVILCIEGVFKKTKSPVFIYPPKTALLNNSAAALGECK
jgi:hypothetical protein